MTLKGNRIAPVGWLLALCLAGAILACTDQETAEPENERRNRHSSLWGRNGERWSEDGRLPDFSHAGYASGLEPPQVHVSVNVRDFGAVGDGSRDDSAAFVEALAAAHRGAVLIPPGRYRLRQPLLLDRSGVVLRGAGPDETILYFELPLFDVLGKGPYGGPFGWAWGGGLIWARGGLEEAPPKARVTAPARRGERSLRVSSVAELPPGTWVRLTQRESDGSLSLHLHNGQPLKGRCLIDRPGFRSIDWVFRIDDRVEDRILLDRPLRVDVRPEWEPEILPFLPTVEEVGVENLKIEFPPTEYNGHHQEPGYNGIYFDGVHRAWVRDIVVENFDTAVSFWHSRYSSGSGLRLVGRGGHYGLNLAASQDCWIGDFEIDNVSLHDLSVSNLGNGNVFSNGKGIDVNFDHHRGAAYENLFSNIDVGSSWRRRRLWESSGTPSGHYTAARETFWNIRPGVSTRWLPAWPQLNVVGTVVHKPSATEVLDDLWVEPLRRRLRPVDLHEAQRRRRCAQEGWNGCA